MSEEFPEPGITAERTFQIEEKHATNLFGEQETPPGSPAATDADADESVRVLGTPQLLAEVEFLGRDSLHVTLLKGTGVVGIDADVTHRNAVSLGQTVRVRTEVTDVTDGVVTIEGTLSKTDSSTLIGEVRNCLQVADRAAFRDRIEFSCR